MSALTPLRTLRDAAPKLPAKFDNMAYTAPRKKPFTERERDVLLALLKKYADIIENKRTDSITVLQKKRTWTRITNEYNSSPYVKRESTLKQLEKAWKNLKAKARNFRLADYTPKIRLVPDPPQNEDDPPFLLMSMTNTDRYRSLATSSLNTWDYNRSFNKGIKSEDANGENDILFDDNVLNERRYHPERIQQREVYSQPSQPAQTQGNVDGIKISSVHSQVTDNSVHSEQSPDNTCESNADSMDSFSRSGSPDIQDVEKHLKREEELHDLKVQLASAQLAKVKIETELQTQLLNEQLRKAKAEADLAEFLLEKNRAHL